MGSRRSGKLTAVDVGWVGGTPPGLVTYQA